MNFDSKLYLFDRYSNGEDKSIFITNEKENLSIYEKISYLYFGNLKFYPYLVTANDIKKDLRILFLREFKYDKSL